MAVIYFKGVNFCLNFWISTQHCRGVICNKLILFLRVTFFFFFFFFMDVRKLIINNWFGIIYIISDLFSSFPNFLFCPTIWLIGRGQIFFWLHSYFSSTTSFFSNSYWKGPSPCFLCFSMYFFFKKNRCIIFRLAELGLEYRVPNLSPNGPNNRNRTHLLSLVGP